MRKAIAAMLSVLFALAGLVWLVPLAAGRPGLMPASLYRIAGRWSRSFDEYHGTIAAELVGVVIVGVAIALYFWIAEPRVITLKYRQKKRGKP